VDPQRITDVYFGAANQAGEDNRNVARMSALLAGLPHEVPGVTVNRLCASGLEAINQATRAVMLAEGDIYLAGGVESMSRAPWVVAKPASGLPRGDETMHDTTLGWRLVNPRMNDFGSTESMGETAENVAARFSISRLEQDQFALRSHRRAIAAAEAAHLAGQIVPVEVGKEGAVRLIDLDEGPRPDTSLERLQRLAPAFRKGGTVTAGNASTLNDGAACLVLASEREVDAMSAKPLARIVACAAAGVDPAYMGIGPIPAIRRVLELANVSLIDVDLVEINEAFASQVLACARELGIEEERLNVNGGAIALGHPLGCSGARLMTTLAHELRRRRCRYGLAALCVGGGQGVATLIENPDATL
jgi:acetyl-CoA acetyltransferase family protein